MGTSHSIKKGLPPGSIIYVGRQVSRDVQVNALVYDAETLDETVVSSLESADVSVEPGRVAWLNVDGVHDVAFIEAIGERFKLHSLTMEDIANTRQRPKYEDFNDYLFLVLKMLRPGGDDDAPVVAEHVSLVLGDGFLLSFQQEPGDVFETVRQRIRNNRGRVRKQGADYLCFALMDAMVDGYFETLERMGERIGTLDDVVLDDPAPDTLSAIHEMKRELAFIRRAVWPLRELVSSLQKRDTHLLSEDLDAYMRDLYDHIAQVLDTVESYRDALSGLTDLYMSVVSNRMNEVMKVLTIIATIFIPITFIAGIYGMNFEVMPELHWRWSYPAVWVVILTVTGFMLAYFRRKRWI